MDFDNIILFVMFALVNNLKVSPTLMILIP